MEVGWVSSVIAITRWIPDRRALSRAGLGLNVGLSTTRIRRPGLPQQPRAGNSER
jgi:hypothetical protein